MSTDTVSSLRRLLQCEERDVSFAAMLPDEIAAELNAAVQSRLAQEDAALAEETTVALAKLPGWLKPMVTAFLQTH